jgi:hypothetical protein
MTIDAPSARATPGRFNVFEIQAISNRPPTQIQDTSHKIQDPPILDLAS